MNVNDLIPVNIAGDVVAQAKVTEIDKEKNTVTMIVPATKVVMGLRVELDTAPPVAEEPTTQTIITGVDRYDGEGNLIPGASTSAPGESAPVVAPVENATNGETPTGTATATPQGHSSQTTVTPPVAVEPAQETPVAPVEAGANTSD